MGNADNADISRAVSTSDLENAQPGQTRADKLRDQIEQTRDPSQSQGEADSPTKEPEPTSVLSGKHRVKWGEAEREISIEELVKLAQSGQEADQTMAAARKLIGKDYPKVQEIARQYENMTTPQREAFEKLLNGQPPQDTEYVNTDEFLDDLAGDDQKTAGQENGPVNQQLLERLSKIEGHINAQNEKDAKQNVGDHIDKLIDAYPDLKGSRGGRAMAKKAIMDSILLNPNQKVEDLVAKYAGDFLNMAKEQRETAVQRAGEPRPEPVSFSEQDYQPLKPERTPTGEDLESGGIRRQLVKRFRDMDR